MYRHQQHRSQPSSSSFSVSSSFPCRFSSPLCCSRVGNITSFGVVYFAIRTHRGRLLISAALSSTMSDMRTDCLHVHLPLYLLYDPIVQHHVGRTPDLNICWLGYFGVCVRRIFNRHLLGQSERPSGEKASSSDRIGGHMPEHAGFWLCAEFANCSSWSGFRRTPEWVRVFPWKN